MNTSKRYNFNRPLSSFEDDLKTIKESGFNPIGVSQIYLEDTFIFETSEEAEHAYRKLERDRDEKFIGKVVGWWHGKEDFLEQVEVYEKNNPNLKIRVYWI